MARCGSGALCTCAGANGCGTVWRGTGQAGVDPYRIDLAKNCDQAGNVIADYVGEHIDVGLQYNQGQRLLSTHLSSDDGQQLRYGTDGGLLYTGTCPDVSCCNTTVAGLPATGIVGGMNGCGKLVRGPGLVASHVQASRQRLHITHMECVGLRDGTPVVYPDYGADASTYSDAPDGAPFNQFNDLAMWDAATWAKLILHPSGPTYDPYNDPPVIDPAAGFSGMREPTQVGGTTLGDVLDRVGGQLVTLIGARPDCAVGVRDELLVRCLHDSAIVTVTDASTASVFTNAQIEVGVRVNNADDAAAWPPQSIIDVGGTWAMVSHELDDATITGYVDAGLQVVAHQLTRQAETARVTGLGVRGIVSDDPLYASSQVDRYRIPRDQWAYRTPGHGLLTAETNTSPHWKGDNRGYELETQRAGGDYGLWVPGRYPADTGRWSVLMGQLCPLPNTTSYRLTFQVQWRSNISGDSTSLGIIACADDDRLILAPEDGNHYLIALRPNGVLFAQKAVGGTVTDLGQVDIGSVSPDTWYPIQVTVATDGMTVNSLGPPNEFFTTPDTDLRGAYFHLHKSQVAATTYTAGFASVIYTEVAAG